MKMNRFKTVITLYGLAWLITLPIAISILWIWSFSTPEGTILTNHYGERLVETILLLTGVPCALYVLSPIVRKFVEKR